MEKKKMYFTEFRLNKGRTVKVYYASPKFRNLKISRLFKEYPELSEDDIIKEGHEIWMA